MDMTFGELDTDNSVAGTLAAAFEARRCATPLLFKNLDGAGNLMFRAWGEEAHFVIELSPAKTNRSCDSSLLMSESDLQGREISTCLKRLTDGMEFFCGLKKQVATL